ERNGFELEIPFSNLSLTFRRSRRRGRTRGRSDRSRPPRNARRTRSRFRGRPHRVSFELARKTELAQLVADHVFGDVHRNKLLPVVYGNRVSHHLWNDG